MERPLSHTTALRKGQALSPRTRGQGRGHGTLNECLTGCRVSVNQEDLCEIVSSHYSTEVSMKNQKPAALNLEVTDIESRTRPGCNSSSTSPLCTCPIY